VLIVIEKPGKAIFLIKERSRLVRKKRDVKKHDLGLRLGSIDKVDEEMKDDQ
jgi:hypothetical protein